jgi:hypothetical protein
MLVRPGNHSRQKAHTGRTPCPCLDLVDLGEFLDALKSLEISIREGADEP